MDVFVRVIPPTTLAPPAPLRRRAACLAAFLLVAAVPSARAEQWTSIGPFGGRTATAVLWDSFDGGRYLYAAIDEVGVFRSPDLGSTWAPAGAGLTNARVSAMVLHHVPPTPPTGCPPPCYGPGVLFASTRGGGVFTLRDGSWSADNSGLTDLEVNALAADPNGVWAGTAGFGRSSPPLARRRGR